MCYPLIENTYNTSCHNTAAKILTQNEILNRIILNAISGTPFSSLKLRTLRIKCEKRKKGGKA